MRLRLLSCPVLETPDCTLITILYRDPLCKIFPPPPPGCDSPTRLNSLLLFSLKRVACLTQVGASSHFLRRTRWRGRRTSRTRPSCGGTRSSSWTRSAGSVGTSNGCENSGIARNSEQGWFQAFTTSNWERDSSRKGRLCHWAEFGTGFS